MRTHNRIVILVCFFKGKFIFITKRFMQNSNVYFDQIRTKDKKRVLMLDFALRPEANGLTITEIKW